VSTSLAPREEGEDMREEKGGGRGYERWQVKKERD